VTSYERDRVSRIDPESGAVGEPIPVGDGPASVAVGDGAVWVVNDDAGTVSKVDIERGEVVGIPIELPSTSDGDSIAVGDGRVWVVTPDQGRIVPIDASSGRRGRAIAPPDGTAEELAFGEGGLWVVGDAGTVTRLDPASGEAGEPVKVGRRFPPDTDVFRGEIAVGEGAVWVAGLDDETVVRVDPRSGRVVKTIRFEDGIEGDLAAGGGAVWVIDESGQLLRIDPGTNAVAGSPLPAGTAGTNDMAVGSGAVWIAGDLDQDTVSRVAP
jgi:streptogramin lyase